MDLGPAQGNSEMFVNATTYPTRSTGTSSVTVSSDYLYVVNGLRQRRWFIDNGWDNVSINPTGNPEVEQWFGSLGSMAHQALLSCPSCRTALIASHGGPCLP